MSALEKIGFRPATDHFHAGIDCVVHDFVSTKAKCYQRYRDISPIFPILREVFLLPRSRLLGGWRGSHLRGVGITTTEVSEADDAAFAVDFLGDSAVTLQPISVFGKSR